MSQPPRFCSRCGAPLGASVSFCQSCGQPVTAAPAYPQQAAPPPVYAQPVVPPPVYPQPVVPPPVYPQQPYPAPYAAYRAPIPQQRFSWAGVISFVLGVLSIAIAVAVAASVMSNGVSTPLANAAGWAVLLMMVIGLILGIVGARIRRGRAWAILGLILNGGYLLLTIIGLLGGVGSSGL